jgi:hypothetical protein
MKTIVTGKMRATRLIAIVAVLLLVGVVLLASAPLMAQGGGPGGACYGIQASVAAGGGYQLSSLVWQVSGATSGGRYSLTVPQAPSLRGSGCCCTYLPTMLGNLTQ